MSSGSATFWSGIVRVTRSTRPGSSSVERVMGDTVPRTDGVDPAAGCDTHDLVLEAEEEPADDCRLGRRIVCVASLPEVPAVEPTRTRLP